MKSKTGTITVILLSLLGVWWVWSGFPDSSPDNGSGIPKKSPQRIADPGHPQARDVFRDVVSVKRAKELDELVIIERFGGLQRHPLSIRMRHALDEWTTIDPEAALQWALNAEKIDRVSYDFPAQVMRGVAAADLEKAMDLMERFSDSKWKPNAAHAIVEVLAEKDPEAALAYAREKSNGPIDSEMAAALVAGMVRTDVPRTLEFLKELPSTIDRHSIIQQIATEWARHDFKAVREWADALTGREKEWALEKLGPIWVQTDPEAALGYLEGAIDHPKRVIFDSLESWGKANLQSPLKWMESSAFANDPDATYHVYRGWLKSLPEEAVAAADIPALPPGGRDELLTLKVDLLRQRSPQVAAAVLEEITSPYQASVAVHFLLSDWCQEDAQAAASWVSTLEEGLLKESSIASLIDATVEKDPDIAAAWLAQVRDPIRRADLIERAGPLWLFFDEMEGRARLRSLGLLDEGIDILQQRIHEAPEDDGLR